MTSTQKKTATVAAASAVVVAMLLTTGKPTSPPPLPATLAPRANVVIQPAPPLTNTMHLGWCCKNGTMYSKWSGLGKSPTPHGPWTVFGNVYLVPPFSTNQFTQLDIEVGTQSMFYVVCECFYQMTDFQQPAVINPAIVSTN